MDQRVFFSPLGRDVPDQVGRRYHPDYISIIYDWKPPDHLTNHQLGGVIYHTVLIYAHKRGCHYALYRSLSWILPLRHTLRDHIALGDYSRRLSVLGNQNRTYSALVHDLRDISYGAFFIETDDLPAHYVFDSFQRIAPTIISFTPF